MYLDRLVVEPDDDGWVHFRRPSSHAGRFARDLLQIPSGFTVNDILSAVEATGWVVERNGELWIEDHIGCQRLSNVIGQMCWYFDRSGVPSLQLLKIKELVDAYLVQAYPENYFFIPMWAYAWLDLVLHEQVAEEAGSSEHLWNKERLTINVDQVRYRLINELGERYSKPARVEHRVAGSIRMRTNGKRRSGSAG